jgi:uncharacterized protein DUF4326
LPPPLLLVVTPMPERIQRKRTKGWRMPAGAVYVGRPTKWGNPFRIERADTSHWPNEYYIDDGVGVEFFVFREYAFNYAVEVFANDMDKGRLGITYEDVRRELVGRDLACWCPLGQPCHADVLLDIANAPVAAAVLGDPE